MSAAYPRQNEVPFDPDRKRMITIHDVKDPDPEDASPFHDRKAVNKDVIAVKGAPDVVLDLCTRYQTIQDESQKLTPEKRLEILAANDAMTAGALRVLGLAYRVEQHLPDDFDSVETEELEADLVFAGLIGMIDPPRQEVRPALEKARRRRHSHRDDHWRLSQYRTSHRPGHRSARARTQSGHWCAAGRDE